MRSKYIFYETGIVQQPLREKTGFKMKTLSPAPGYANN